MSSKPNVLVLPAPTQGHINPFLSLSQKLVEQGFGITFVNTEFNHKRIMNSQVVYENTDSPIGSSAAAMIRFVSIPDGLEVDDDRLNHQKLLRSMQRNMPALLEKLIQDIACLDGNNRITCIIADFFLGWALEVGRKMGIKTAVFWTLSAANFSLTHGIPKLIDDGIIDSDGFPTGRKTFQLSPSMPKMSTDHLFWSNIGDSEMQKGVFHYTIQILPYSNLTDWWLGNTTYELEPAALSYIPKLLSIGPLLRSHNTKMSLGQFWEEDLSCLAWLDQQPHCSVIYVAFGSLTVFEPNQFEELALGLDLTNKPFLWVVRPNIDGAVNSSYPDNFLGKNGKIVKWAPQQKVLSHPSIACFISHCGWNSTMEGVCNGVPFLCWPYFGDQPLDMTCICDEWKVGLGFDKDEEGIVSRGEIKKKAEQLLGDGDIRVRSLKLKELVMNNIAEGGRSSENFIKFVKWMNE